jgi:hypothetical protein
MYVKGGTWDASTIVEGSSDTAFELQLTKTKERLTDNLARFTSKNPKASETSSVEYGKRLLEETAIGNLVSFYFGGWIEACLSSGVKGGTAGAGMFDDLSSGI